MMPTDAASMTPIVSIVMPIFNRRRFLPAAFEAILAQQIDSWQLVVIDDGSTDGSEELVDAFRARVPQSVLYIRQANQGAYGARNTGVAHATGKYIAFYDSDDVWLPHHLSSSVAALEAHDDVDWVYAACEIVDLDSQRVLQDNCFYQDGRRRPFMTLAHDVRGPWCVIRDRGAIECQITHGLYCGLQNSVLRHRVFDRLRFTSDLRNEAEDQLFAIRALAAGFRLAYVDRVHVRYHVHGENSSGAAKDASLDKLRRVYEPLIAGYERLGQDVTLTPRENRALRRRLGYELFWHLGYAGYWKAGERVHAIATYERALRTWPWAISQWKTYCLARVRGSASGPNDTASSAEAGARS
jgi:glycosyltransferase involved in cell wall biosynthesis